MQLLQQSEATAAQRRIFFQAVDVTDGITPETGLTGTGFFSKNGAAPAASASIVEISAANMPGRYYVVATVAELDTLGMIVFRFKTAATAEVIKEAQVVPYDPYDAVRLGLTALPNAAAEAVGGLYTRGTGAGQINQPANGQIDASVVAMAAAVLTAAAIAANAIDGNAFAQAAADKVFGSGGATLAELPQGIPPANPRPDQFAMLFYMALRNRAQVTATELAIFNDALVKIAKAALSDDGTTFQRDEMISGA